MTKPAYNKDGVPHLYSSDSTPAAEAAEVARLARAMRGVNTSNKSKNEVFNPGDEVDPRHPAVPLVPADTIPGPGVTAGVTRLQTKLRDYDRMSPFDDSIADETRAALRTSVRRATGRDPVTGK